MVMTDSPISMMLSLLVRLRRTSPLSSSSGMFSSRLYFLFFYFYDQIANSFVWVSELRSVSAPEIKAPIAFTAILSRRTIPSPSRSSSDSTQKSSSPYLTRPRRSTQPLASVGPNSRPSGKNSLLSTERSSLRKPQTSHVGSLVSSLLGGRSLSPGSPSRTRLSPLASCPNLFWQKSVSLFPNSYQDPPILLPPTCSYFYYLGGL